MNRILSDFFNNPTPAIAKTHPYYFRVQFSLILANQKFLQNGQTKWGQILMLEFQIYQYYQQVTIRACFDSNYFTLIPISPILSRDMIPIGSLVLFLILVSYQFSFLYPYQTFAPISKILRQKHSFHFLAFRLIHSEQKSAGLFKRT